MLEILDVTKTYRVAGERRTVLSKVSLSVRAGELAVVTGKSGSGKTTLLNVVAGIAKPDRGSVTINGKRMRYFLDLLASRKRNREMGFIFQTFRLLNDETVMTNVLLPARIAGRVGRNTRRYAYEVMSKLKIYRYRKSRAGVLSGGQKQRVAIARALVNRPGLILADEPTANLDRVTAGEIFAVLEGLRTEGKAVVLVSHDEYQISRADSVYAIDGGVVEKLR